LPQAWPLFSIHSFAAKKPEVRATLAHPSASLPEGITAKPLDDPLAGFQYGPECAAFRERARDTLPIAGLYMPTLLQMPMMPMPVPSNMQKVKLTIDFVVDSVGNARGVAIVANKPGNARYIESVRRQVEQYKFRPAHIGACAVQGNYTLIYDF